MKHKFIRHSGICLVLIFFCLCPGWANADTIFFKDGTRLDVEQVWKSDDQVHCEMFGTVVSYPEHTIERIETPDDVDQKPHKDFSKVHETITRIVEQSPSDAGVLLHELITNEQTRSDALKSLASLGDGVIVPLIHLVESEPVPINTSIAAALMELPISGSAGFQAVAHAMDHPDSEVRRAVLPILTRFHIGAARNQLLAACKDPDPEVRKLALQAFMDLKDPRRMDALMWGLHDPVAQIRQMAANALTESTALDTPLRNAIHDLKHGSPPQRLRAVDTLASRATAETVSPLITALQDPDAQVRQKAITGLTKSLDPRSLKPLITAMADADKEVADAAKNALASFGTRAMNELILNLTHSNPKIRIAAANILASWEVPQAFAAMMKVFDRQDLPVIASCFSFYLAHYRPGMETVLILALKRHGSPEMARGFAHCGIPILETAGTQWMTAYEKMISQRP